MNTSEEKIRVIRYQTKRGNTRQVAIPEPRSVVTERAIILMFEGLPTAITTNKTHGQHWSKHYDEQEYWKMYGKVTAEECGARVVDSMAHLHWHVTLPDKVNRDEDNFRGGMKYLQDGLVLGGVIRGDSIWDIETKYTFEVGPRPGFTVTITSL